MRKLLIILVCLLLCASMALAQDLAELTQKAQKGDVDAQYALGRLYFLGSAEVKQDRNAAWPWFVKAMDGYTKRSQEGDLEATYLLGIMYINGFGVDPDLAAGTVFVRQAAENNYEVAQHALSNLIILGRGGVTKDYEEAFNWALRAAEQGYAPAYSRLGDMYMRGLGVDKNITKGMEYYLKAADADDTLALYQLGERYAKGQYVEQDYAKALEYWQKAADLGHSPSQNMLGVLNFKGLGTTKDLKKAYEYFQQAAQNGEMMAFYNLGYVLYHGYGVAKDSGKALQLFNRLLATGRPQPQYMAGLMYANGEGTAPDYPKAYELLEQAATRQYLPAQYLLGKMHYNGTGSGTQDPVRAYIWLTAAKINADARVNASGQVSAGVWIAEEDPYVKTYSDAKLLKDLQSTIPDDRMAVAAYNLGLMYQRGLGFNRDNAKALSWFMIGAAYGHEPSRLTVEKLAVDMKAEEVAKAKQLSEAWLKENRK